MLAQGFDGLVAQCVLTQCADGHRVVLTQELAGVVGKVGGSTAQFLTFGEYVPQDLSQSYYKSLVFHGYLTFLM